MRYFALSARPPYRAIYVTDDTGLYVIDVDDREERTNFTTWADTMVKELTKAQAVMLRMQGVQMFVSEHLYLNEVTDGD